MHFCALLEALYFLANVSLFTTKTVVQNASFHPLNNIFECNQFMVLPFLWLTLLM